MRKTFQKKYMFQKKNNKFSNISTKELSQERRRIFFLEIFNKINWNSNDNEWLTF